VTRAEIDKPEDEPAFRAAIYQGRVFKLAPTDASCALASELLARIAHMGLRDPPPEDFVARLGKLRSALAREPHVIELARATLASHGVDSDQHALDCPRVRAILHRGHEIPAAAPVYVAHRDTWYANPRAQINWWLALHDVDERETFEIFPELLDRPVTNDSAGFDYDTWIRLAGWQNPNRDARAIYPSGVVPEGARSLGFSAAFGEMFVFAGAHLHRTRPNVSGRTRFSADFRTVHLDDRRRGLGAAVVDDRSTGDAMRDYEMPRARA